MGLGDGVASASCLHDAEGRTLIRPWGRLGATRLVPPEREAIITRFIAGGMGGLLTLNLAVIVLAGWPWALALLAPEIAAFVFGLHRLTRDLAVVDAVPVDTTRDLQVRIARGTSPARRGALAVVSLLFTTAGVWMGISGKREGWLIAAFFGLCAAVPLRQMRLLRHASAAEQAVDAGTQG
jgi:hypothetical protein